MAQYLVTYEMAVPKLPIRTVQMEFTADNYEFVPKLKQRISEHMSKYISSAYGGYVQTSMDIEAIRILFMMEIK